MLVRNLLTDHPNTACVLHRFSLVQYSPASRKPLRGDTLTPSRTIFVLEGSPSLICMRAWRHEPVAIHKLSTRVYGRLFHLGDRNWTSRAEVDHDPRSTSKDQYSYSEASGRKMQPRSIRPKAWWKLGSALQLPNSCVDFHPSIVSDLDILAGKSRFKR